MIYDALIIGGGPAGLMAANMLEKNKINYLLLEKNERVGKKILLTGGKRCNVTNNLSVVEFINELNLKDKRFLYHALNAFGPKDILRFFKDRGLNLILENNFKYFPETHKSQSVVDALLQEVDAKRIRFASAVKKVSQVDGLFHIETLHETYTAKQVLISTGSKAYPSVGSSGDGLVFAEKFGIPVIPFTPAETYVYSDEVKAKHLDLQGVVVKNTTLKILNTKKQFQGDLLFTHFGLSGPIILQASEDIYDAIEAGHKEISISFTDQTKDQISAQLKDFRVKTSMQFLEFFASKKIALKILESTLVRPIKLAELSGKEVEALIDNLTQFKIRLDRVESIDKAFVNRGGVDTKALDPKTMHSRFIKGLYFAGELTNLHGPIGGFNITIALSTGRLAALSVVESLKEM